MTKEHSTSDPTDTTAASNTKEPPERTEIDSQEIAIKALEAYPGQRILLAEYAQAIANAFGITLQEHVHELQPISAQDRLQPNNESLGIGVGSLCKRIADELNGIEAEDYRAGGRGFRQDGLKLKNLEKIKAHVHNEETHSSDARQ
jgi:hypothetical protein